MSIAGDEVAPLFMEIIVVLSSRRAAPFVVDRSGPGMPLSVNIEGLIDDLWFIPNGVHQRVMFLNHNRPGWVADFGNALVHHQLADDDRRGTDRCRRILRLSLGRRGRTNVDWGGVGGTDGAH